VISIVCVYNNERILKNVLLKSLENQTVHFELILLDNRDNRFKSAAEALNFGGAKAKGDYLMFVHQDMWLGSNSWVENTEKILDTIPDLGVAGVAGVIEKEKVVNWKDRHKYSITIFDEGWRETRPVDHFEEVQTLDECLLIVPRSVFNKLKFDQKIFDGWDCYGADYCLAVKDLGLKAYVTPGSCSHCCVRAKFYPWEFSGLLKYQKRLHRKYKRTHSTIYTWVGRLSWFTIRLRDLLGLLGHAYTKFFPRTYLIIAKEIHGCDSVLDLGCGHLSPIHVLDIPFSCGVELSEHHLQESKRLDIHSHYILGDIRKVEFKPKSFDAVIALNVLEHLTKQEGIKLLEKMQQWARKKVVIKIPNTSSRHGIDTNKPLKDYKSNWDIEEFKEVGFKIHGIDGWNGLELENIYLREFMLTFTQKIVFYIPKRATELIGTKICEYNSFASYS